MTVQVADDCPTCNNENSIDLSQGAFTQIATIDEGEVPSMLSSCAYCQNYSSPVAPFSVTWEYVDSDGSSSTDNSSSGDDTDNGSDSDNGSDDGSNSDSGSGSNDDWSSD